MNIKELSEQCEFQGAYHIKIWNENVRDYSTLGRGKFFECDYWNIKEKVLNAKIQYMYVTDNELNIEVEF